MNKEEFKKMTNQQKLDLLIKRFKDYQEVTNWHYKEFNYGKNKRTNAKDACNWIYEDCGKILAWFKEINEEKGSVNKIVRHRLETRGFSQETKDGLLKIGIQAEDWKNFTIEGTVLLKKEKVKYFIEVLIFLDSKFECRSENDDQYRITLI